MVWGLPQTAPPQIRFEGDRGGMEGKHYNSKIKLLQ